MAVNPPYCTIFNKRVDACPAGARFLHCGYECSGTSGRTPCQIEPSGRPVMKQFRECLIVSALLLLSWEGRCQDFSTHEPIGRLGTNRLYTPVNQVLTPAGVQVELPGL